MRRSRLLFVLVLALGSLAPFSKIAAQIRVVPPGLSPGSPYRLLFVTSQLTTGSSTNVDTYNTFVSNVANSQPTLAGLGTTWKAIASTQTIDARDNTGANPSGGAGVPFYRLDGLRVADSNGGLWNASFLEHEISITEVGGTTPLSIQSPANIERPWVWTGSTAGGVKSPSGYLGVTSGPNPGRPVAGVAYPEGTLIANAWIGLAITDSSDTHAFYAMSGVLTVPNCGTTYTADYDGDCDVDGGDLATWEAAYGASAAADTDGDGDTDGADFLAWQREYTGSLPLATVAAVPEPSAGTIATALALVWMAAPRRNWRL